MRLRKAQTPLPSKWAPSSQALIERLALANIDRTMQARVSNYWNRSLFMILDRINPKSS
jgi:hypothetical protein